MFVTQQVTFSITWKFILLTPLFVSILVKDTLIKCVKCVQFSNKLFIREENSRFLNWISLMQMVPTEIASSLSLDT